MDKDKPIKEKSNIRYVFNINRGDIISIVGSGGKTNLLFYLAEELKDPYKVLVTTSTKIGNPNKNKYDFFYDNVEDFLKSNIEIKNGITVISKSLDKEKNKLIGIDDSDLERIYRYFDIILIEADGSRTLPLKGWKDHEPPVLLRTNKTIGIIPIKVLGRHIDKNNIYGFEEFKKITNSNENELITEETIKNICIHENGLFKNSRGKKYLFINQADDDNSINKALKLAEYLYENIKTLNIEVSLGSLRGKNFFKF